MLTTVDGKTGTLFAHCIHSRHRSSRVPSKAYEATVGVECSHACVINVTVTMTLCGDVIVRKILFSLPWSAPALRCPTVGGSSAEEAVSVSGLSAGGSAAGGIFLRRPV